MEVVRRDRIKEEVVRKAVKALLKWKKKKKKLYSQSDHEFAQEEEEKEEEEDDAAHKIIKAKGIPFIKQVLKVSKLKSDYKSFDSKKKLYDSFDVFFAVKNVVPLLPKVLGKVFYNKKKKIPVPVELRADGSNWKEEIEKACKSSLLCLSGGTCSALRVGRWGLSESEEIVENVFEAIDGVLEIVPKKWGWIRCFHLKFSDSLALPIYDYQQTLQPDDNKLGKVGDAGSGLVGTKRKSAKLVEDYGRKK
ncbi:UNVERIFIED_CONTAM: Ribosomal L1 domain-containing protein 1 [Sesamum radiatum]|uniref:Ribosomal L1 domain-containing protein 1 n=1 Tax=Sesamum radiatum TaxID=300843 RepID=A0AAW2JPK9_SESRA